MQARKHTSGVIVACWQLFINSLKATFPAWPSQQVWWKKLFFVKCLISRGDISKTVLLANNLQWQVVGSFVSFIFHSMFFSTTHCLRDMFAQLWKGPIKSPPHPSAPGSPRIFYCISGDPPYIFPKKKIELHDYVLFVIFRLSLPRLWREMLKALAMMLDTSWCQVSILLRISFGLKI